MREQPSGKELNINQLTAHDFLGLRLQSLHLRRPFQRAMPFQILGDAALFCKPAHQRTDLIVRLAVDAGEVLCQRTVQQHLVAFKGPMLVKKTRRIAPYLPNGGVLPVGRANNGIKYPFTLV